jgi:hypothetical protein
MLSPFDHLSSAEKRWSAEWHAHKNAVSIEEARKVIADRKLSNRGNLEAFTAKYGEELGRKKFIQKQERSISRTFEKFKNKHPDATHEDFQTFNRQAAKRCPEYWQAKLQCTNEEAKQYVKAHQSETSGVSRAYYELRGYDPAQINLILGEINRRKDSGSLLSLRTKYPHLSEWDIYNLYKVRSSRRDNKSKAFFKRKFPEASHDEIESMYFQNRLSLCRYSESEFLEMVDRFKQDGINITPFSLPSMKADYKWLVSFYTAQCDISHLPNFEKRGIKHGYELDHIYTISDGFRNRVPAEVVGSVVNLRVIPMIENRRKHKNSEMSLEKLYELYHHHQRGT